MFKKVCFLLVAFTISFSGESFARKPLSPEQGLAKRSHVRARTNAKKIMRTERSVTKRSARQIARAKKAEENSLRQNRRVAAVQKKQVQKNKNRQVSVSKNNKSMISKDNKVSHSNTKRNITNSTSQTELFTGRTILKNVRKDSLNVSGPFEFDTLEVNNNTDISGPTLRSRKGKFNKLTVSGPLEATDVTCKKLDVSGPLRVENLTVDEDAIIAGPVKATNMTCRTFNGSGPVTVTKLKVEQDATIAGRLEATQSHFQNLKVSSDEILLKDTNVDGNIMVKKNYNGLDQRQVLRLEGKTTIKGTITFESGNGIIEKTSAVMLKGVVRGAKVQTKSQ